MVFNHSFLDFKRFNNPFRYGSYRREKFPCMAFLFRIFSRCFQVEEFWFVLP